MGNTCISLKARSQRLIEKGPYCLVLYITPRKQTQFRARYAGRFGEDDILSTHSWIPCSLSQEHNPLSSRRPAGMLRIPGRSESKAQRHLGLWPEICWYPGIPLHPSLLIFASFSLSSQGISSKEVSVFMICQFSLPLSVQSLTSEEDGNKQARASSTNTLCSQITNFSSLQVKLSFSQSVSARGSKEIRSS